jgi:uncharacterized protein (DUF433 family)
VAITRTNQIEIDEQGVAWIADANTKVVEVVLDRVAYGWSPEEIHFQHSHLSLAQIHAALAYYYENKQELDAQIERRYENGEELARQCSGSRLRRKLAELKRR